jgi:hypothetical protein
MESVGAGGAGFEGGWTRSEAREALGLGVALVDLWRGGGRWVSGGRVW